MSTPDPAPAVDAPVVPQTPAPPAPAVAPRTPAPAVANSTTVVGPNPFQIAVPDLRNGALVNIQQAAPKASMSVLYHWPIITGATHADQIAIVEYLVRACYAQALTALSGGTVNAAEQKKKAIVLGGVRAGASAAFKLGASDLTQSELVSAGMTYSSGAIGQSAAGTTSSTRWTQASSMEGLSTTEWGVIATCVYMGMAVAPLQGVSLVMTGHHYIPPTYNLFMGLKRQALGTATKEVADWIGALGENFDDMAFHKALHPVSPLLKRQLAKDQSVKARLSASGHGSVAIRLPAVPSEASGGKAVIALLTSAASTAGVFGHQITASTGITLMLNLQNATDAAGEAAATDAIVKWIASNLHSIAFCGGIIQHVHEVSGVGKNTILAAYSIKRIMSDSPASVAAGTAYARAALGKIRDDMTSGKFADPAIAM